MPRLESFFRETASGLRRNGVVAFAAMSTSFIALFLFGLSLLIAREFELVTRVLTGNVEVQVYLNDPANPGTVARLAEKLQQVPAVANVESGTRNVRVRCSDGSSRDRTCSSRTWIASR